MDLLGGGRKWLLFSCRNLTQNGNCSFIHLFLRTLASTHEIPSSALVLDSPWSTRGTVPVLLGSQVHVLVVGPDVIWGTT